MIRSILVSCVAILLLSRPVLAEPCWGKVLAWNHDLPKKESKLMILPFENFKGAAADQWTSRAIPLLLGNYLALSKKVAVIPPAPDWWVSTFDSAQGLATARKQGAKYLIIGRLFRKGQGLQVETIFLSVPDGQEIKRVNGTVEFPATERLNEFLVLMIEELSKTTKDIGLKKKDLLPFLHQTSAPDALRFFTAGSLLLLEGGSDAASQATAKFEEAIKQDYNYVPGYLGLAESLVSDGLVQKIKGGNDRPQLQRARLELEKARLLNPPYTEKNSHLIDKYLQAYVHEEAGNMLKAQGNLNKAVNEYQQVVALLPGDVKTHGVLAEILQQLGSGKKGEADKEANLVQELNECEN